MTRILAAARPEGKLFLNSVGNPWTKDLVAEHIRKARRAAGLPEDIVLYAYRHTYATDALAKNIPAETVAALLGHRDTRMIQQTYGHLDQVPDHLRNAAALVNKPLESESPKD